MIKMILAVDSRGGIGKDGNLPWHIPSEFRYFKYYTRNTTCIMGRKTYDDIEKFKKTLHGPFLSERTSIVFTRDVRTLHASNMYDDIYFNDDLDNFIEMLSFSQLASEKDRQVFCVIGGKTIYERFAQSGLVDEISITFLNSDYDCDTFIDVDELIKGYEVYCSHLGPDQWNANVYRRKNEKQ